MVPTKLPFQFRRLQLPVQLRFSMTINKAQDQKLNAADSDLNVRFFPQCSIVRDSITCHMQTTSICVGPKRLDT